MKRNLITILILALVTANVVLSAVTMLSVTSTNKKTSDMVLKIASALDMELESGYDTRVSQVSMEDTATYNIADSMTIPLKHGPDGKDHYCVVSVSLAMNTKDKDYGTYSAMLADKESLIKGEIINVISGYTLEEIQVDAEGIRQACLERVQAMFGSGFIYQVTFSDIKYS